jgi:hypothetical protein
MANTSYLWGMFKPEARNAVSNCTFSLDQTTRIHGAVPSDNGRGNSCLAWHELSRPQVHGHDLIDVAFLDPLKFISISDEKVARVFEAPREFVRVVKGLGVAELSVKEVYLCHRTQNSCP